MRILKVENKEDEKFLRTSTGDFDFKGITQKEIRELTREMKEVMLKNNGVGLAANQVGLPYRMFIAADFNQDGLPKKIHTFFNPEIEKRSEDEEEGDEGCLSIPGKVGKVCRSKKVVVCGQNKEGKKIRMKAEGFLARVFQHEMDHLDGILFTDKATEIWDDKGLE